MRILFITGRELSYARNEVLHHAFQQLGTVDVIAPPRQPDSLLRSGVKLAVTAARRLLRQRYDLVVVGFYGHLVLALLRPLLQHRWPFRRPPLLFDAFVSNYDTLCFDRQHFSPTSLPGRVAFRLDQSNCQLADHILLDTTQHVDYFVETFGIPISKFTAIPVGCSESIYHPRVTPQLRPVGQENQTVVLSYTTFLPLHGMETVLQAASQLQPESLHFRIIGDGPLLPAMQQLAATLGLQNVTFVPLVPPSVLATEIAGADICLGGHFGENAKAGRVVPR